METWIIWFIVADIILTVAVVLFVIRRRLSAGAMLLPQDAVISDLSQIGPLMAFGKERHERIVDYVRANWSGIPNQLPGVLASLLDQLEREAHGEGHTFSRELLKTLVATSLRSQRVAKPDDVEHALAKAA